MRFVIRSGRAVIEDTESKDTEGKQTCGRAEKCLEGVSNAGETNMKKWRSGNKAADIVTFRGVSD